MRIPPARASLRPPRRRWTARRSSRCPATAGRDKTPFARGSRRRLGAPKRQPRHRARRCSTATGLELGNGIDLRVSETREALEDGERLLACRGDGLAAWLGAVHAALLGGIGTLVVVGLWMFLVPTLHRRQRLQED